MKAQGTGSFSGKRAWLIYETRFFLGPRNFLPDFPLPNRCSFYKLDIDVEVGLHPNKWDLNTSVVNRCSLALFTCHSVWIKPIFSSYEFDLLAEEEEPAFRCKEGDFLAHTSG